MSEDRVPTHERSEDKERVGDFCRLAVSRTGVDGMAVAITDRQGSLEPVFGTDATADVVAELQFTLGQGPGSDAAGAGEPVLVGDLSTVAAARRWPQFAPEAFAHGVQALFAFPLGPQDGAFGAALLYRKDIGELDDRQVGQAVAATELLTLTLVDPRVEPSVVAGVRMSVHQAAGMVMQQTGSSIQDALVLLRATAYLENRPVTELAASVIAGGRRFEHIDQDDGG